MAELGEIIERVAAQLGPAEDEPEPLEGGITNHNYLVRFAGRDCVLRLPGKDTALLGISREAERIANEGAARLGLAPVVLWADPECLVTVYAGGRPLAAGELAAGPGPVATALRAFHDSGVLLPVRFWVPELLGRYATIVGSVPDQYEEARAIADRIARALPLTDPVPCHNDLLPANLLATDRGPLLVDWEYAGMGHRMFDLGNLAAGNELDERGELALLAAYLGHEPGLRARAELKLMRLMSDAREAAWGVVQAAISELDFDFGAYAERHFARLAAAAADPRLEEWLDATAAPPS